MSGDNMDEIELLNAAAYMSGDYSNIPKDERDILDHHFENIKNNYNSPDDFRTACVDAFDYYKDKTALKILLIRMLTDTNIIITYAVVPEFKDLVNEVGPFLRTARNIF